MLVVTRFHSESSRTIGAGNRMCTVYDCNSIMCIANAHSARFSKRFFRFQCHFVNCKTTRCELFYFDNNFCFLQRDGVIQLGDQPQLLNANAGGGVPHHQQQQMVVRQRDNAAAIRSTEATIVQLGEIYQQFSYLVKEQGDMVTRIDTNLDDGGLNVEYAHSQLVDFLRHLSSRRGFMLKFFVVLLLIFGLLVLIKR